MGRLIAIANQKGGVGKTTTAVNLAIALATSNRRVLLVDLDPQGNATSGLIADSKLSAVKASGKTIYEALVGRIKLADAIKPVREAVTLAPSGPDLVGAEIELATMEGRERRLKEILAVVREDYAYILVDTPPSLGLLTLNALVAADAVIVPMQCEYYALEGLSALLGTIKKIRATLNPALKIEGLVLTMFDARNRLSHEIAREVQKHFPDLIFESVIPRNVRLSESPSHGLSVIEYEGKSAGAEAYKALADELLSRNGVASNPAECLRYTVDAAPEGKAQTAGKTPPRRSWSLRALFSRDDERGRKGG
ncbi:MAG: ParA family protein [Candidatus Binataceae bacterium]